MAGFVELAAQDLQDLLFALLRVHGAEHEEYLEEEVFHLISKVTDGYAPELALLVGINFQENCGAVWSFLLLE